MAATYSASLYQFKQALQSQSIYTTVWQNLPADVSDPTRIAWESQDTSVDLGGLLSNFAAGAFLMVLRPFKVDDYISGGGVEGTVPG